MPRNTKMIILVERSFHWDQRGYRKGNYLPLETIDDLVYQFNYVGFNDLCIYPLRKDMDLYIDSMSKDTKGIYAVMSGHTYHNQTGK